MTVDASKGAYITNATAVPLVLTNSNVGKGRLMESVGYIAPTAAAEAASTYRFCRVPSNGRISQVLLSAADFTTAGAIDIGIYQTADYGGAVVDRDLFASAGDLSAAAGVVLGDFNLAHESGEYTFAEAEKPLWEVLGLTADSHRDYDVVAYVTTAFNGGQPMLMKVRYTV